MADIYNVATALERIAGSAPEQLGVVFPAGRDRYGRGITKSYSYAELNDECDKYAHGLTKLGISMGEHVLLLIHPGAELIAVVYALLKMGAVPVVIDPGMGRRAFVQCVAETEPVALIGQPPAHILRKLVPTPFRTVKKTVVVNGPAFIADTSLKKIKSRNPKHFQIATTTTESKAAIAFTSGSTGIPKGVVYRHGMFKAQIELLQNVIGIQPGEVDLALLYVFAFFNPSLGMTTIFPDMDPTKSAEINPAYVVESILKYGVTNAFGSPTIWKRVAPYCTENQVRLPSLKRVIMAGAPVPPALIKAMYDNVLASEAEVITPYGATEAMPLTLIDGKEILNQTAKLTANGKGMCVGKPMPGIQLKVITATQGPITKWTDALEVKVGEIGEIVVKGPMVTRTYVNRPDQTELAKIKDEDGIWHRMGDVGYFDNQGRLWFCGRKRHRVFTEHGILYPVQCEAIFNHHPDVFRSALVGIGNTDMQRPILIIECHEQLYPLSLLVQQRITMELLALGAEFTHTRPIKDILFYTGSFPTDVRHNVKIQREKLAIWAAEQLHIPKAMRGPIIVGNMQHKDVAYTGKPRIKRGFIAAILGGLSLIIGIAASIFFISKKRKSKSNFTTHPET
jgi:acyl-CoA synthetase (AMP-forming)/AMP-acid ligase II